MASRGQSDLRTRDPESPRLVNRSGRVEDRRRRISVATRQKIHRAVDDHERQIEVAALLEQDRSLVPLHDRNVLAQPLEHLVGQTLKHVVVSKGLHREPGGNLPDPGVLAVRGPPIFV